MSPHASSWLVEAEVGVQSLREAPGPSNHGRTVCELRLGRTVSSASPRPEGQILNNSGRKGVFHLEGWGQPSLHPRGDRKKERWKPGASGKPRAPPPPPEPHRKAAWTPAPPPWGQARRPAGQGALLHPRVHHSPLL